MDITAKDYIHELAGRYSLQEDKEHIIVPFYTREGKRKRCFLLKRRYIRIVFKGGHFHDYPLHEVIEATLLDPEMPLTESILLVHKEPALHAEEPANEKDNIRGEGEEENTYKRHTS